MAVGIAGSTGDGGKSVVAIAVMSTAHGMMLHAPALWRSRPEDRRGTPPIRRLSRGWSAKRSASSPRPRVWSSPTRPIRRWPGDRSWTVSILEASGNRFLAPRDRPQLPAFRYLSPEQYQDAIADLVQEIEEEGERRRAGDSVAGVDKFLSQDPLEPPTRLTKRSPRPLFHVASKALDIDLSVIDAEGVFSELAFDPLILSEGSIIAMRTSHGLPDVRLLFRRLAAAPARGLTEAGCSHVSRAGSGSSPEPASLWREPCRRGGET